MPPSRPSALLLYNPRAGRRRHGATLARIVQELEVRYAITARATEGPGHATVLAAEAASTGSHAVFAWGGDGTLREAAQGLLGSPTALGVLPGGTFNVVALALGLPRRNPVEAARRLVEADPEPRDVGFLGSDVFLMQATFGLDGAVMHGMNADNKARFGMAGAVLDGLRVFARYVFPRFEIEVDGRRRTVTGAGFVNMAEYAGAFEFVPGARWDDGRAHVLLYKGRSRFAALRFAAALALGRHKGLPDVEILEASILEIVGPHDVPAQADGDPWRGAGRPRCRLAPAALGVLIPRART